MKKSCMVSTISTHHYSDEVQEDEMGGTCAVYGGEENAQSFGGGLAYKEQLGSPTPRKIWKWILRPQGKRAFPGLIGSEQEQVAGHYVYEHDSLQFYPTQ